MIHRNKQQGTKTMTNLEKSTILIDAMNRVELYSKLMQQYFGEDGDVSFEDYKEYEKRVEEAKEIIFNLAMGE